ncbi:tripartite motif-containing protein 5-like isoform X2 [Hippopotamus amphibius kiboko]|uniref:tripartite motif-containing protein 5-like isoform X2 n=1 Tax=Hippopotamus amphibius kiboko TaxID=575201 RepID=UPI002596DEEC|nr:tripartite motif-containing protein 5-like isoform X2 [Hippopotamus amphibius kiboko]
MASEILVNIQEEVICPICLELLTEPLSLDCGHTFCQACITASNKNSVIGQDGESSCPVCRTSYHSGNLRPNKLVANIVRRLRDVKLSLKMEQKRNLCVQHEEKLLLFCEKDGEVICWACERSQKHRGHHTLLVEEVSQEYQSQIELERQNVQEEFKKLRAILDSEELKELQKLKSEEGLILSNLTDSEHELVQQSQLVKDLISDLEHRLQGSTVDMLQDVNDIMKRSENLTLKKPKRFSKEESRVFRAPDLRDILRVFNELTDMQRYWVHVTLNPVKLKKDVVISADQRQVKHKFILEQYTTYRTDDYEDYGILGSPVITSGRHYWEVDVSRKRAWILGVYSERRPEYTLKLPVEISGNCQNVYLRYQPKYGYWVIWLSHDSVYNAFKDSSSSDPLILTLCLSVPPRRIGVFLDYKAGTVLFLNVTNHGFPIYKFSSCSFSQKTFPYFSPMKCDAPMTLCSPSS